MNLKSNTVRKVVAKPKTLGSLHIRMYDFEICTFDISNHFFYTKYGNGIIEKGAGIC